MKKSGLIIIFSLIIIAAIIGIRNFGNQNKSETVNPPAMNLPETAAENPVENEPPIVVEETKPKKEIIQYTVQSGDTVGSIARQFGITVDTILSENNLTVNSVIKPGDELSILPFSGITYIVKSGDSISKIALISGATADDIIQANDLSTNTELKIGQVLLIPGVTKKITAPTPVAKVTVSSTSIKKSSSTTSTASSTVTWTADALSELKKIPAGVRPSVKTKITNYAQSHGITVITKDVYLSIKV
jgi:LysM repeat protein